MMDVYLQYKEGSIRKYKDKPVRKKNTKILEALAFPRQGISKTEIHCCETQKQEKSLPISHRSALCWRSSNNFSCCGTIQNL